MSNYVFGYISGAEKPLSISINAIRARTVLGFHDLSSPDPLTASVGLPITSHGLPIPAETPMSFCVSDDGNWLDASHLIFESDFADPTNEPESSLPENIPFRLSDRLGLIEQIVHALFKETKCVEVGLWLSVCDELEGIVEVPLSQFGEMLTRDFEDRGIPCLLYQIARSPDEATPQ